MSNNIDQGTYWEYQDVLGLSIDDWKNLLLNENIFHKEDIEMVLFVYYQDDHKSTATEISKVLGNIHYNKITAQNRSLAKRIYNILQKKPPLNTEGDYRYWNVIFDCDVSKPKDEKNHWYWILRPNLVEAIKEFLMKNDYFKDYSIYKLGDTLEIDNKSYSEGERKLVISYRYERNPIIRKKCIENQGAKCKICGFDFGKMYGGFVKGKIHVHHIIPLSIPKENHIINPDIDLIPVCPNCHYIIHLRYPPYLPDEVKDFIKTPR